MNHVVLIGRLTKDPELRTTASGTPVASFTLAVDRRNGKDETDFINCKAWSKQAENLCKYQHKGSQIAVFGPLHVDKYEKDGQTKYSTEVVCNNIEYLGSKADNQQSQQAQPNNQQYQQYGNPYNGQYQPQPNNWQYQQYQQMPNPYLQQPPAQQGYSQQEIMNIDSSDLPF